MIETFYTYQDLQQIAPDDEARRMDFVRSLISQHRNSDLFKTAQIADEYERGQNRTIRSFQKLLYTVTGKAVADNISANFKLPSKFFSRFTNQEVQTLLGNGVTFSKEDTAQRLGADFDARAAQVAKYALDAGVCYAFFNLDHIEVFPVFSTVLPCFVPLDDEETGATSAGVRFWQLADGKPLRATLFELDGYTDYIWRQGASGGQILTPKRPYIIRARGDRIDAMNGTLEYIGENYPAFPIVPLWANVYHQSELEGLRENIDCYDLIKSGFANNVDEASLLYWTISNAGGMDDVDLSEFVRRLRTVKAATVENGEQVQSHSVEAPYNSREAILNRLEKDLYRDAMAVNTDDIAAGNVTATQIRAAYDAHNSKVDQFELCVIDFIQGILTVAGLDDTPTFTRSTLANTTEQMQTLMMAATHLPFDYVTQKALEIMGDGDRADELLKEMDAEDADRLKAAEARLKALEAQQNGGQGNPPGAGEE